MTAPTTVIYGDDFEPDVIAFIPEDAARELADLYVALSECATWGELRERVSPERYAEILELRSDAIDGDETHIEPDAAAPFSAAGLAGVGEDWPELPKEVQEYWMPDDVKALGEMVDSQLYGSWLQFTSDQAEEVVAALRAHRYEVRRDDALYVAAARIEWTP